MGLIRIKLWHVKQQVSANNINNASSGPLEKKNLLLSSDALSITNLHYTHFPTDYFTISRWVVFVPRSPWRLTLLLALSSCRWEIWVFRLLGLAGQKTQHIGGLFAGYTTFRRRRQRMWRTITQCADAWTFRRSLYHNHTLPTNSRCVFIPSLPSPSNLLPLDWTGVPPIALRSCTGSCTILGLTHRKVVV